MSDSPRPVEGLITDNELAEMLRVTRACLAKWRSQGRGPAWIKVGASPRYRVTDVVEWLDSNRQEGGAA